jgi:GlpG protein
MRSAGTIRDKLHARRFADFLLTRGIHTRLDGGGEGFTVWVVEEDRLAEVRAELPRFLAEPDEPRYSVAREAEALRAAQTRQSEALRVAPPVPVVPAAARVGLMATPLALALVVLCVVVAAYTQFAPLETPPLTRMSIATVTRIDAGRIGWNGLEEIANGEVWRLITPCFVHFGLFHLGFNMMWLLDVGRQIEAAFGTLALAAMVLVLGVASNYGQYGVSGPYFGGMSGVIFGLFGFVLVMSRFAPATGLVMSNANAVLMMGWFVVCMTGLVGPIANVAHGLGLALGAGFGGIAVWLHHRRRG